MTQIIKQVETSELISLMENHLVSDEGRLLRERLKTEPQKVIEEIGGVPENISVEIYENTPTLNYFVMPMMASDLNAEDIQRIIAGGGTINNIASVGSLASAATLSTWNPTAFYCTVSTLACASTVSSIGTASTAIAPKPH